MAGLPERLADHLAPVIDAEGPTGGAPERAESLRAFRTKLRGAPLSLGGRRADVPLRRLRAVLGEEAFAAAWSEGRAMTLENAIAHALADVPPGEAG